MAYVRRLSMNGVKHCKLKARECNANEFKNINGVCYLNPVNPI